MTSITNLITLRLELICLITVRAPLAEGALTTTCGIIIKDHPYMAGIIFRRRLTLSMIATQHPHPSTNCTPILIDVFPQTHHLNPHAYTSNCYEHWLLGAEERAVSSLYINAKTKISPHCFPKIHGSRPQSPHQNIFFPNFHPPQQLTQCR